MEDSASRLTPGAQLHSNGFRGERERTHFVQGASVSLRDVGDRRAEDQYWVTCCQRADVPAVESIAGESARRALARRGAQKIASGRLELVRDTLIAWASAPHLAGQVGDQGAIVLTHQGE